MTPSEFGLVVWLLIAAGGALLISIGGVAITIATGSLLIGWLIVPGGMVALANVQPDGHEALWMYGGMTADLALWTALLYPLVGLVRRRFGRHEATG